MRTEQGALCTARNVGAASGAAGPALEAREGGVRDWGRGPRAGRGRASAGGGASGAGGGCCAGGGAAGPGHPLPVPWRGGFGSGRTGGGGSRRATCGARWAPWTQDACSRGPSVDVPAARPADPRTRAGRERRRRPAPCGGRGARCCWAPCSAHTVSGAARQPGPRRKFVLCPRLLAPEPDGAGWGLGPSRARPAGAPGLRAGRGPGRGPPDPPGREGTEVEAHPWTPVRAKIRGARCSSKSCRLLPFRLETGSLCPWCNACVQRKSGGESDRQARAL